MYVQYTVSVINADITVVIAVTKDLHEADLV